MSEQPIIILENVNKWFGDLHVLQDVSLSVGKKERIVVCGPSGSGKSIPLHNSSNLLWLTGERTFR